MWQLHVWSFTISSITLGNDGYVTVCGVNDCTLSFGFHPSRLGWMNLNCGEEGSYVRSLLLGLAFLPSEKEESQTLIRALISLLMHTMSQAISLSRCVVYVWLCYVLVLFVSGGWYLSCSDTRSLFTWQLYVCNFTTIGGSIYWSWEGYPWYKEWSASKHCVAMGRRPMIVCEIKCVESKVMLSKSYGVNHETNMAH